MSDYQIDDEYTCTEDFFMEAEHGGDRAFTKGKVYKISDVTDVEDDGPTVDVWLMDDMVEEHGMDDALMKQHFKKSKDSAADAYDRAMGII